MDTPRWDHPVAVLMPDARVLVASGEPPGSGPDLTSKSAQIYFPPCPRGVSLRRAHCFFPVGSLSCAVALRPSALAFAYGALVERLTYGSVTMPCRPLAEDRPSELRPVVNMNRLDN